VLNGRGTGARTWVEGRRFGARPMRPPLSIGDPTIVTGSTAVVRHAGAVRYYTPGGLIDVVGSTTPRRSTGSPISYTTVDRPTKRAQRSASMDSDGGEIAINAREGVVISASPRAVRCRTDFGRPRDRPRAGRAGSMRGRGGAAGRGPSPG